MPVTEKEFNNLLVQYRPFIIGQVLRWGGGDDTEDYVQDVMLQVCRGRQGFDPDKGSFPTWLRWQIRSCLQQRRVYQNRRSSINHSIPHSDEGEPLIEASTLSNQHDHSELRETLEAACKLKPREAHAVLQRAIGSSFVEIGKAYSATAQYAQQLHELGLQNLRRQMKHRASAVVQC